ncbi:Chorismate synthase [bacterium HR11]|nr:Chorismate synthase [bacterium HR11]
MTGFRIRVLTAGESHGPALVAVVEGFPAGVPVDLERIQQDLRRRQVGIGRGARMKIERDEVRFLAGVRFGRTLGSPLALLIENRDWVNWQEVMDPWAAEPPPAAHKRRVIHPRPGHADLAGGLKFGHTDLRNVLERASARETAVRTAVGALCKGFLALFGVDVRGHVRRIGGVGLPPDQTVEWDVIRGIDPMDPLPCVDAQARQAMIEAVEAAGQAGDTLGGVVEVIAVGVPPGLGSYTHWDRRLDARLAAALMSIPSVKAVEVGDGIRAADLPGSLVHDEIFYSPEQGFYRLTNRAGGLEGGVTNGAPVVVRIYLKPLATLRKRLRTVSIETGEPHEAAFERSDVCAVVPAVVIAEALVAWVLADAWLEKFGGDCLDDVRAAYEAYRRRLGLLRSDNRP